MHIVPSMTRRPEMRVRRQHFGGALALNHRGHEAVLILERKRASLGSIVLAKLQVVAEVRKLSFLRKKKGVTTAQR